ncbi:hypothetical protein ACJJTC_004024 [Scirpophaga incertulas]
MISDGVIEAGRRLRTRLDLLKPNIMNNVEINQRKQVKYAGGSERLFVVGERVWVRDFGRNADPYVRGVIMELRGSRNFVVETDDGRILDRHVDQLKKCNSTNSNNSVGNNISNSLLQAPIVDNSIRSNRAESITSAEPLPSRSAEPTVNSSPIVSPGISVVAPPPLRRSARTIKPPQRFEC